MADLTDLIARLEKATGPDREFDLDIDFHLNPGKYGFRPATPAAWENDLPQYTASIDDALTLVPEGMGYGVKRQTARLFAWVDGDVAPAGNVAVREASTLPIALCIAALKARQVTNG